MPCAATRREGSAACWESHVSSAQSAREGTVFRTVSERFSRNINSNQHTENILFKVAVQKVNLASTPSRGNYRRSKALNYRQSGAQELWTTRSSPTKACFCVNEHGRFCRYKMKYFWKYHSYELVDHAPPPPIFIRYHCTSEIERQSDLWWDTRQVDPMDHHRGSGNAWIKSNHKL